MKCLARINGNRKSRDFSHLLVGFWRKIQNASVGLAFADDVNSSGFVVIAAFHGVYIFSLQ